jgi:sulfite exporter TauE/SafE
MLYIAFMTGLLGSFHCIGMCAPIAMMLSGGGINLLYARLLYNIGRSLTYAFIGSIVGVLGWGISLAGYQQWLSIAVGSILLVIGFMNFFKADFATLNTPFLTSKIGFLKKQIGKFIQYKTFSGNFVLGIINGFLPCGLVYVALVSAVSQGDVWFAASYMFVFGLGTIPLMMLVLMSSQLLRNTNRIKITKVIPVFTVLVACFIILRGLNLGIPYLSPKSSPVHAIKKGMIECHK